MKLTLATKKKSPYLENGVSQIGKKELIVIDDETGEQLQGCCGMIWGDKSLVLNVMDAPLLTPEHLENHGGDNDDASYMVLVIRCDKAIEVV